MPSSGAKRNVQKWTRAIRRLLGLGEGANIPAKPEDIPADKMTSQLANAYKTLAQWQDEAAQEVAANRAVGRGRGSSRVSSSSSSGGSVSSTARGVKRRVVHMTTAEQCHMTSKTKTVTQEEKTPDGTQRRTITTDETVDKKQYMYQDIYINENSIVEIQAQRHVKLLEAGTPENWRTQSCMWSQIVDYRQFLTNVKRRKLFETVTKSPDALHEYIASLPKDLRNLMRLQLFSLLQWREIIFNKFPLTLSNIETLMRYKLIAKGLGYNPSHRNCQLKGCRGDVHDESLQDTCTLASIDSEAQAATFHLRMHIYKETERCSSNTCYLIGIDDLFIRWVFRNDEAHDDGFMRDQIITNACNDARIKINQIRNAASEKQTMKDLGIHAYLSSQVAINE